jgi:hypothetical protein
VNAPPPYQPPQPPQPYPPQGYAPEPPGPPGAPGPGTKKKMSGCLVALAVVAGVILFSGLVVAVVVYRFVKSPDGQKIVSAVSSGAALVSEATNAPGTKELRTLGCSQAMVIDAAKVQAIAAALVDGGSDGVPSAAPLQVVCVTARGRSLGCDAVAATYVQAVGRAAVPFAVSVGASGAQPTCEGTYMTDGTRTTAPRATE